ncbi:MAG: AtpZ/AtpI family protein [Candidatus Izimaplasma sp.]|nr:AtpZ/AtpI family protein [Candidatus Izimaplasma bacterium]
MSKNNNKTAIYIFNMVIQFFYETFFAMALGYFLGKWFDRLLFDSKVILTYILIIFGVLAGLRNLIKRALKFDEGDNDEK